MASIELATAYISLATSANEISREIGRAFAGADKIAADAGRDMGRSMAKTFEAAKPDVSKLAEDYERAQDKVRAAAERGAKLEEGLARKVEIAQKKKAEAVEKYGEESSQALVAVDRLALAEQKLEAASMGAASEQERLQREVKAAGRALEDAQMDAKGARRELERTDNAAREMGRELVKAGGAFEAEPTKRELKDVQQQAGRTADRVEDEFDEAGRQGGRRMGEGVKSGLNSIRNSFIGNFAAGIAQEMFAGVKSFIGSGVGLASEAEQAVGGVEAVFKDFAAEMNAEAAQAWDLFGLSTADYQNLATPLGAMLKNQGIEDFAGQTQDLIGLGADLAAMFGGPTSDAVSAISSLMRGEADPIERYGVSIKEAAVNARLAEKGLSGLEGAALDQAKAMARLELLFEQTSDAQGAFSREAETDAGRGARAMARLENAQTKLGEKLMPYQTAAYEFLADKVVPALETAGDLLGNIIDLFKGDFNGKFWGKLGIEEDDPRVKLLLDTRDAIQGIWDIFTKGDFNGDVWGRLGIEEDDPRVDLLFRIRDGFEEIGGFIQGGGLAGEGWTEFGETISAGWENDIAPALGGLNDALGELRGVVDPIIQEFGRLFSDKWQEWSPETQANVGQITQIIGDGLGLIAELVRQITDDIEWVWDNFGDEITLITGELWDDQQRRWGGALDILQGLIKMATGIMQGDWNLFAEGAKQTGRGMWDTIQSQFTLGQNITQGISSEIALWVGRKFEELRDRGAEAFATMADRIGDTWDRIKGLAAEPVNFVIREVYMGGLKPLVDGLTGLFGGDPLPAISEIKTGRKTKKASGGVLPGYTPGRDVHTFWSPTAGTLMLSGGEAIMRPEWTRAVGGPGAVDAMNRQARRGYRSGGVWPAPGVITSPYGYRVGPFNGAEIHDGIDIGAPLGTPVVSALPGIVTLAGWNGGYGNQVTVDHGGFTTFYAHLDAFTVAVGDLVDAGSLIGKVGSTGWSTGPHLHFGSSAGDPAALLSGDIPASRSGGAFGALLSLPGRLAELSEVLDGYAGSGWGRLIAGGVKGLLSKVGEWATSKMESWLPFNSAPGQGGTFDGWWAEALAIAGPEWSVFKDAVRTVAQHESGMDPGAVNNWDINAINGTPSKGLLQFIKPTFDRWAWPGHDNWLSPVDQILAFFRYVPGVYGSIWNHPGLVGLSSGAGYRGYWRGTTGAAPGPAWLGEREPELVVSRQLRQMRGGETVLPLSQLDFGGDAPDVHVHVTAQGDDLDAKLQQVRWAAKHDLRDTLLEVMASA